MSADQLECNIARLKADMELELRNIRERYEAKISKMEGALRVVKKNT